MKRRLFDRIGILYIYFSIIVVLFGFLFFIGYIFYHGIGVIDLDFLFENPRNSMIEGGIFAPIVGTVYVTLTTAIFATPIGIMCAIFLIEYSKDTLFIRLVRASLRNLASVPSIVYGLFGVALFVDGFGFGSSILASGLTLGLMTLPWIVSATEEALVSVPLDLKLGAYALGANRLQCIRSVILPYALPGITTGIILGLSRAAGETAPILFTGVAFYLPKLPGSLFDQFMALPYHLYILSTQHQNIEKALPVAYGTALVLLFFVSILNILAIVIRTKMTSGGS